VHRRSTDGATLGSGGAPSSGGVPGGGAAADDQTEREGWFSSTAAETAPSAAGRPPFATRCHASRRGVQKVPKPHASRVRACLLHSRHDPSGRYHPPPAMRVARPALRPDAACGSVSSGSRARCRAHRRWPHRRGPPTGAHLRPRQRDSLSLSGGCFQRQIVPQAVPGYGQPRPISRLGPRWPATQTFIFHTGAHSCRRTCMAHAALHDSSTRAPWPGRLNWVRTCQSKVGWRAWSAGARELYCTSPSSVNSARASRVAYRHGATATRRAGRPESAAAHAGRRNMDSGAHASRFLGVGRPVLGGRLASRGAAPVGVGVGGPLTTYPAPKLTCMWQESTP
jgi:hypothetical protein